MKETDPTLFGWNKFVVFFPVKKVVRRTHNLNYGRYSNFQFKKGIVFLEGRSGGDRKLKQVVKTR